MFPYIEHIDDVMPYFDPSMFIHVKKEGYSVINYLYNSREVFGDASTFEGKVRREFRGIIFDTKGKIISRPFHKFFNVGECEEANAVLNQNSVVQEKLDGSMVRAIPFGNTFRLGTKMGITDVSMQAEDFIVHKQEYIELINECIGLQLTPIFEWTAQSNRIILDYKEPQLTLLAVRDNNTGDYINLTQKIRQYYKGIPVVKELDLFNATLVEEAKKAEGIEGYVLVHPSGARAKLKTDWYVLLHKSKELASREKDVVKCIMEDTLDDLLPLLQEEDKKKVKDFALQAIKGMIQTVQEIEKEYKEAYSESRKEFALRVKDSKYKTFLFKTLDGNDILEEVKKYVAKAAGTNKGLEEARDLYGGYKYSF